MTLVITGGSGTLGRAMRAIRPDALAPSRSEMDVTDRAAVRAFLSAHPPSSIIHAAALTSMSRCEAEKELANRTNVQATEELLRIAREVSPGCYFLFISSAGVFRGDAGGYDEDSPTSEDQPVNHYGLTKLRAERAVLASENTCVVRTNFVKRGAWPHERAFTDRFGTFLHESGAAKAILEVHDARLTGIVHVVGNERLSLFELARRSSPAVLPMTASDHRGPPLTMDMTLLTKRWKSYSLDD